MNLLTIIKHWVLSVRVVIFRIATANCNCDDCYGPFKWRGGRGRLSLELKCIGNYHDSGQYPTRSELVKKLFY